MSVSLLELLLAREPSGERTTDLRLSVLENIRFLLESRQPLLAPDDDYPLARRSLLRYGLSVDHLGRSYFQASRLSREIEVLLRYYEPRLTEVMVEMVALNERVNSIRFHIEGVLVDRQQRVPVGFDSVLNLTDARVDIVNTEELGMGVISGQEENGIA
ncbi:type VI secretion system baseplate subunit TssE [Endozoicomonas sp. GU-1]|uniref:type VI secretion system baseplate subunit TssE n=1 Tax=Endozoicomonas sp. GU-1 TaxID=3009078 RepID=UPI0022B36741|nr:type VI secretion system baseplate subunit TssE [Endozoicomonas sp. GU-1]WBA83885.1 type VI secretion system baseplate subunit TssE [Endozoicomonas sp. GU-1]WBA86864.1 type VI secretion system baseplate subunit TssE [Endozoicomonas sp. GU-1]